jgi:N-acyl-D-amino-acid deacylase
VSGDAYDIAIRNGRIIDGTGAPAVHGDVGIRQGRIVYVGPATQTPAGQDIDARGAVVCPGFVDVHGHAELSLFVRPDLEEYVSQGVTTVINGNCGHSMTPGTPEEVWDYMFRSGQVPLRPPAFPRWDSISTYRTCVDENGGIAINAGCLLGHGTLRWGVMGRSYARRPTTAELEQMKTIVAGAMEQGALGISTGLPYIPNCYADTEEIIEIAAVVGSYHGVYASHVRHEAGWDEGVEEAIRIGRESGVNVQISHLPMTELRAYDLVRAARVEGLSVTVDTIPRKSGIIVDRQRLTQFALTFFPEYFGMDFESVKKSLATAQGRQLLRNSDNPIFAHDMERLILVRTRPELEKRSVADIARGRGQDPMDCLIDLLLDEDLGAWFWLGRPEDPRRGEFPPKETMGSSFLGAGSDILVYVWEDNIGWYDVLRQGAFPIFLQQASRCEVPLEEIIQRITSLPADTFGLGKRGALKEGWIADVVVFDPIGFDLPGQFDLDYDRPINRSTGVLHALVGGTLIWSEGRPLEGAFPGKVLSRKRTDEGEDGT